jgi:ribose-phosphate pyrophosphokinase
MPSLNPNEVRFFSGRSHPVLAGDIASFLSVPLEPTTVTRFSNDNLHIQLGASVRGRVVFLVQSLSAVSDLLIELLMMPILPQRWARVHAVSPIFRVRSDKKALPISITARLIADLLQTAGATHVMTMTLHSPQVHGFFKVPTDPLTARHLFVRHFISKNFKATDTIVVSPDVGRAKPAARFAYNLKLPVAAAQKQRISDRQVFIGDTIEKQVEGYRRALIYDDEIVTGSTILELCRHLIDCGVQEIAVICTHGLFASESLPNLAQIHQVSEIITTDTVPIRMKTPTSIRQKTHHSLCSAHFGGYLAQYDNNRLVICFPTVKMWENINPFTRDYLFDKCIRMLELPGITSSYRRNVWTKKSP